MTFGRRAATAALWPRYGIQAEGRPVTPGVRLHLARPAQHGPADPAASNYQYGIAPVGNYLHGIAPAL